MAKKVKRKKLRKQQKKQLRKLRSKKLKRKCCRSSPRCGKCPVRIKREIRTLEKALD